MESFRGGLEDEVLMPIVLLIIFRDAALQEAGDDEVLLVELPLRAEGDERFRTLRTEGMEVLEVALSDVVTAAAVGADDALGLVGCNQVHRAAAVGAVEAHGFDARGAAGLQTDVDSERLQRGLLARE